MNDRYHYQEIGTEKELLYIKYEYYSVAAEFISNGLQHLQFHIVGLIE
jgi:hypothetical protein